MITGSNPGLLVALILQHIHRAKEFGRPSSILDDVIPCGEKLWIDAGYSIDAPVVMAAGSTIQDIFGPDPDDVVVGPSLISRETP
jgi:hypothetical protein